MCPSSVRQHGSVAKGRAAPAAAAKGGLAPRGDDAPSWSSGAFPDLTRFFYAAPHWRPQAALPGIEKPRSDALGSRGVRAWAVCTNKAGGVRAARFIHALGWGKSRFCGAAGGGEHLPVAGKPDSSAAVRGDSPAPGGAAPLFRGATSITDTDTGRARRDFPCVAVRLRLFRSSAGTS